MNGARIWQKKDLYNMACNQQKQAKNLKQFVTSSKKISQSSMPQPEYVEVDHPLDIKQCLTIQPKDIYKEQDIDQSLKQLFTEMKTNQKNKQQSQGGEIKSNRKKLFFTPRCMVKVAQPKTQPIEKTEREKQLAQRKQRIQFWRMNQQIRKQFKVEPDSQKKLTDDSQKTPLKQKQEEQGGDNKEKKKTKKSKTTQNKKKKIKKEENHVRLNLKRRYRDRFVGKLNKNIKELQKSKKMRKWGISKPELQMNEGELYNSYINSLSKALYITFELESDGQQCSQKSVNHLQYEIPESYDRQSLQKLINQLFGFDKFREGQYETISNILAGKSTLFVSETASGKSLTYILPSVIMKGLSIVVSPLVSLMLDQLQHLPNDLPAACMSSLLNYDQKKRMMNMVKEGKIQLLFVTPETFLTDFMFHIKEFPTINFICIDEAHSLSELSHSFRASYLCLEQILLKYFKYKKQKPVILCLTATANQETMASICETLQIEQTIKSTNTINKNLFITISKEQGNGKLEALTRYLSEKTISSLKGTLIYCRTKYIMEQTFNYLRNSGIGCRKYHSELQQKEKVEVMSKFREGKIKIVIATISLGMGLDFANLECIVHINMPKSIQNYVQQIGRAGRRQKRAYCHLFLDQDDYFTVRNYFLADELEHAVYIRLINELKKKTLKIDKSSKKKKSKKTDEFHRQTESLKRLSIDQEEDEKPQAEIFYEQEGEGQRALHYQDLEFPKDISPNKNVVENEEWRQISYCKSTSLVQITGMNQESILNILLKIQKVSGRSNFKVLPLTHETIKISFFKKNKEEMLEKQQIAKKLLNEAKIINGKIYLPVIKKCNELKITPIQLLTEIYSLSSKYTLKIQLINDIFVWATTPRTLIHLQQQQLSTSILQQFNRVQRTALTKFNIFYCVCFNNAKRSLLNIISNQQIIPLKNPLPHKQIITDFDDYFKQETYEFYHSIIKDASVQGEQIGEAGYLPLKLITQQTMEEIKGAVTLFMKHIINSTSQKKFIQIIQPYRDGRTITRVFMGVNDSKSSWKIYGQHVYWKKFKEMDYRKLLEAVKQAITEFIRTQGPFYLNQEKKSSEKTHKKQQKKDEELRQSQPSPQNHIKSNSSQIYE